MMPPTPTERSCPWPAVVLLAHGLAVLMATRYTEGEGRRFTVYDLNGQLRCWRVWCERPPVPAAPTDDNLYEFAPEVYRVLTPALCSLLAPLGDPVGAYQLARLVLFTVALLLLFGVWRRQGLSTAAALALLLLYAAALSGLWCRFRLRDILHAVLLLVCLAGLLNRRWAWLLPAFALAALNREDAALVPLLAAVLYWSGRRDRWLLQAAATTLGLLVLVRLGLVLALGPRPYHAPLWQLGYNWNSLLIVLSGANPLHPVASRLAVQLPLFVAALLAWRRQSATMRACLLVALAFALVTFVIGRAQELEHEAYVLVFLAPPAVAGLLGERPGGEPGT